MSHENGFDDLVSENIFSRRMEERGLKKKRTKAGVEYEDVAGATSPSTPFSELVEGVEGVAPEPSSLRETTIENEGCRATPLHIWCRYSKQQQPDGLCRRKVAKVDGGVFVSLACSRPLTDNREVGQ